MKTLVVITPWVGSNIRGDAHRPKIRDDYELIGMEDVTGQPSANLQPNPNLYIVQIECDEATLNQIIADPKYPVVWSEE